MDIQSNAARLVLHGRNCSAVDSKQKTLLHYLCQKQAEVREDLPCNHTCMMDPQGICSQVAQCGTVELCRLVVEMWSEKESARSGREH